MPQVNPHGPQESSEIVDEVKTPNDASDLAQAQQLENATWLTQWCQSQEGVKQLKILDTSNAKLLNQIQNLRKQGLTPQQASTVMELRELRQRATRKFTNPDELFFTRRSLEQASGGLITRWKIDLIKTIAPKAPIVVIDICCGVGGDLLEIAKHFPVIGIDSNLAVAHLAETNLQVYQRIAGENINSQTFAPSNLPSATPSRGTPSAKIQAAKTLHAAIIACLDAKHLLPEIDCESGTASETASACQVGAALPRLSDVLRRLPKNVQDWAQRNQFQEHYIVWHFDPDRRDSTGRHTRLVDFSPDESFLRRLVEVFPMGIAKIAPATQLSDTWLAKARWQWIGLERECKQLIGIFAAPSAELAPHNSPSVVDCRSVAIWQRDTSEWETWSPKARTPDNDKKIEPGNLRDDFSLQASALPLDFGVDNPDIKWSLPRKLKPAKFLFEPHSAIYAARLQYELAAEQQWAMLISGDYFTGDIPPKDLKTELFDAFSVVDILPLRAKAIAKKITELGLRLVEVKKRQSEAKIQQALIKDLQKTFGGNNLQTCSLLIFQDASSDSSSQNALKVAICHRLT